MVHNQSQQLKHLYKLDGAIYPADVISCRILVNTVRQIALNTGVPVRLIVLDTLARCFAGGDENRASDMGAFIAGCDYIKNQTGATILVVHHIGKDATAGARGSSALRAACDYEFSVGRIPDELGYVLKHTKSKDSRELADRAYRLSEHLLFVDDDGDEETTLVASLTGDEPPEKEDIQELGSDNHKAFMRAVHSAIDGSGGSIPVKYIRDDLKAQGLRIKDFSRWQGELVRKNLIHVSDKGFITLPESEQCGI